MLDAYPFLQNMYSADNGKQTPMRGQPVFIAQHATATCCRECIRKWHKMQPGKELSQVQQEYHVDVIMTWIQKEMKSYRQGMATAGCFSKYGFIYMMWLWR